MRSEDQAFTDYWILVDVTLEVLGFGRAWEEEVRNHYGDGTSAKDAAEAIIEARRAESHVF